MKNILILLLLTFFSNSYAILDTEIAKQINANKDRRRIQSRNADCILGNARIDLDVNNVRAGLLTSGDLWWDRDKARYGVPKRTNEQLANGFLQQNPIFAGSIWISGLENGNLKCAAVTYSGPGGYAAFWPGPLSMGNPNINVDKCNKFDRFFSVTAEEINKFVKEGDFSNPPSNIKYWPAKGNPNMGDLGYNLDDFKEDMAPFFDMNDDGVYNPADGDHPAILQDKKGLYDMGAVADQMIFWVINDVGNSHAPDGAPIGVEMNCLAFAFKTSDELNSMTFYRYQIVKKSANSLTQSYISQFVDPDMGDYNDDYIGCDTSRDLGYCYNARAFDNNTSSGAVGYGDELPIIGVDFFEGPKSISGNIIKMSGFSYFTRSTGGNQDPRNAAQFRNTQLGLRTDGSPFRIGGDCLGQSGPTTSFCFPGNPAIPTEWSMCSAGLPQRDVRFVQNSGPFTLNSGEIQNVSIGITFTQQKKGEQKQCRADVEKVIFEGNDKAQALFDNGFRVPKGPDAPDLTIVENDGMLAFTISNSRLSNNFGESFARKIPPIPPLSNLIDSTYTFEGYLIFQCKTPQISSIADLFDANKSILVKNMDLKNQIAGEVRNLRRVINTNVLTGRKDTFFDTDVKLVLENTGISKTFTLNEDYFEDEGVKNLVNNKTYYYAAVAYAYNDFRNPNNLSQRNIQKLLFSSEIKIYSAIPHNTQIYGQSANSSFLQSLPIKRINGVGNGSYFLNISQEDENEIIANGSKDELTYLAGFAPIKVYVNDPYKVKNASYRLTFSDTGSSVSSKFRPEFSHWTLEDLTNGKIIESERTLGRDFSQPIFVDNESIGITVDIKSITPTVYSNLATNSFTYGIVGSEILYEDKDNKWLDFLANEKGVDYKEWFKTGTAFDLTNPKVNSAFNYINIGGNRTRYFSDVNDIYSNILGGKVAPYCLTSNLSIATPIGTNSATVYTSFAPGFRWRHIGVSGSSQADLDSLQFPQNNLDSLFSFDLVISKDNKNWSKCVVLETGESHIFNQGFALKGQIRQAPSRDINLEETSGTGISYFPGYVIDLETGKRKIVLFGENSRFLGKNAGNMIFDPSSDTLKTLGTPVLGGMHFIYITDIDYSESNVEELRDFLQSNFNLNSNNVKVSETDGLLQTQILSPRMATFYKRLIWAMVPLTAKGFDFYDSDNKYKIPSDIRIKVRVDKPFDYFLGNNDKLIYEFNTNNLEASNTRNIQEDAFSKVRIVPNPYNAYSIYENSPIQNVVRILDVPEKVTVSIFTIDGVLIRRLKQDLSVSQGNRYGTQQTSTALKNIDNSLVWDMRTNAGVMVSSGVYIFHIESPDFGTKVIKLYATMRSADVSNF